MKERICRMGKFANRATRLYTICVYGGGGALRRLMAFNEAPNRLNYDNLIRGVYLCPTMLWRVSTATGAFIG